MEFPSFDHIDKRQGRRLPHWRADPAIYHVVFRLGDSLPQHVVDRYFEERDALEKRLIRDEEEEARLRHLFSERIDAYLDASYGACYMRRPEVADAVAESVRFFDGNRILNHAWCVMPNHVHMIVQPIEGHDLDESLRRIKSFSAKEINRIVGRKGGLWLSESYDHIIRSEAAYHWVVQYVTQNPIKARLKNWRWVYPSPAE